MNGAPVSKIFEGVPPTREEAPEGYLTSSCGNKFQRANALLFEGCVGVVLTPDTTGIQFEIKKSPLK
mgnify:FL=1